MAALLVLFLASGCATTSPEQKAFQTEKLLVAAGFTYKVAETPETLQQLKNLPQHKLIRQTHHGKPIYLFADVAGCSCLYAGSQTAHERLKELVRESELANAQEKALWSARIDRAGTGEDATSYVEDLADGMLPDVSDF
jgi:hypothetical protein